MIRLLVICILLLVTFNPVYAFEDIGYSRIAPSSPIYFLKTIRESLEMKFAATPRVKMIRQLEFATRRLREVNSLILTSNQDLIEPTLERYWYHIQSLSDELGRQDVLAIHLGILQSVYDRVSNPRARMAIRATVNRIIQRADVSSSAKLTACGFLAKEASSSALTQIEQVILMDRANKCTVSVKSSPLK